MKKNKFLTLLFVSLLLAGCSTGTNSNPDNKFGEIKEETPENEQTKNETLSGNLEIHYLDVGQADSSLIIFPDGKTMLIDAGNNKDGEDIVSFIKSKNIDTIDFLVGTHPHADHIGGLDAVINNFEIGDIYMPKIPDKYVPTTVTYKEVLEAAKNKGEKITSPKQKDVLLNENSAKIEVLSDVAKINTDDMNTYSIVLKINYGNNSFMFCGDADSDVEDIIMASYSENELKSDILRTGHHGSYTASSEKWLDTLKAKHSIISSGVGNQYGHPHDITLKRLSDRNINNYRTDSNGNISAISNGNDINISSEK